MRFRAGSWYLDGISSFGDGCARPDSPGGYTRVNAFPKWIQRTINRNLN
jgi:secreted trypsin-like serine protease